MKNRISALLLTLLLTLSILTGCAETEQGFPTPRPEGPGTESSLPVERDSFDLSDVPEYRGEPYAVIHGNVPYFTPEELTEHSFETYTPLDELGRCGVAESSVGVDIMPTEKRGSIGQVKPTGWKTAKYDFVDGKYLYNRCHLLGYQLTGENANERNLITGTRYLNVEGMLPFENLVADYVKETENHVQYRVTPVFDGDDLVAAGVLMEGFSVEDGGEDVCFCVFAYNVQPGVVIDYATGENWEADRGGLLPESGEVLYVLNTSSKKFHLPDCSGAQKIKGENRADFQGSREDLLEDG